MSSPFLEAFSAAHRAAQEAFNEGDFDRAFLGLAPEVTWEMRPSQLESGTIRGREAVIRYFQGVRDGIEWEVEAQEFIPAGEGRIIVRQRGKATGRTTRISAGGFEFFQLWEVGPDGQVVRVREFDQLQGAVESAGLSESASDQEQ
jgi:ketosteroid isomerase-like protein